MLVSLLNFNYTALSGASVRSHYGLLLFCGSLRRTGDILFLRPRFLTPVRFTGLRSFLELSSTSPFILACWDWPYAISRPVIPLVDLMFYTKQEKQKLCATFLKPVENLTFLICEVYRAELLYKACMHRRLWALMRSVNRCVWNSPRCMQADCYPHWSSVRLSAWINLLILPLWDYLPLEEF